MSYAELDPIAGRMGRLDCVCAPGDERGSGGTEGLARLAVGFGLAILAQTLVLAALPLAASAKAPRPALAGLPYAICLLGAALATFPASYLLDAFGRRAQTNQNLLPLLWTFWGASVALGTTSMILLFLPRKPSPPPNLPSYRSVLLLAR